MVLLASDAVEAAQAPSRSASCKSSGRTSGFLLSAALPAPSQPGQLLTGLPSPRTAPTLGDDLLTLKNTLLSPCIATPLCPPPLSPFSPVSDSNPARPRVPWEDSSGSPNTSGPPSPGALCTCAVGGERASCTSPRAGVSSPRLHPLRPHPTTRAYSCISSRLVCSERRPHASRSS